MCASYLPAIYLRTLFEGWSPEVHDILGVTKESEIEQRDLYDRPPSVFKPWTKGHVALLGDAIHAMMPNLGQVRVRVRVRVRARVRVRVRVRVELGFWG